MEKLITLLNEYDGDELEYTIIDGNVKRRVKNIVNPDKPYKWCSVRWYSKSFGFIKWLVENDKIDLKEFHRLCGIINQDSEYWNGTPQDYEQVIMYLSISDYPIEDLISILI